MFPLLLLVVWRLGSGRGLKFLLPLAIGSALHLLLDGMFTLPSTLLWPFMGWVFVEGGHTDLFSSLPIPWALPWNVHWLVLSEFLGGLFIAYTLFKAWRKRSQSVHVRPRASTWFSGIESDAVYAPTLAPVFPPSFRDGGAGDRG